MLRKFKVKFDWKMGLFLLVLAAGIFLRTYNFGPWLYFKLDQARDAFISLQAFEKGPGYLPLLGARAGGTYLLLGPIYYYFQYFSLLITHNTYPTAFAYPDLFFSILAIPMFFLFAKKYFSRDWSMYLASVYALCFFAIEYSRFSWNTNPLPFFTLLYFYALLEIFHEDQKKTFLWTIVAGLALSVASQLHFLAFLGFPAITAVFLVINRKSLRKKINWKIVALFAASFFVLYAPWILSDAMNHWKNTIHFWDAVLTKIFSATLWQDVVLGFEYFAIDWLIILTGYVANLRQSVFLFAMWLAFILPAVILNWKLFRREKDPPKKRFLLLTFLWFLIFLAVYVPIGQQLRARYFLVMEVLPLIYLGYIFIYLRGRGKIWRQLAVGALAAGVVVGNLAGTYLWFNQLALSEVKQNISSKRTFIFKDEDGVVLWHIDQAAKYIVQDCDGKQVFYATLPVYLKSVDYMLRYYGINDPAKRNASPKEACYYAVGSSHSELGAINPLVTSNFHVVKRQDFGLMSVYRIEPNDPQNISSKKLYDTVSEEVTSETKATRVNWRDVFSSDQK